MVDKLLESLYNQRKELIRQKNEYLGRIKRKMELIDKEIAKIEFKELAGVK